MKPMIAVTMYQSINPASGSRYYQLNTDNINAILKNGGIPVMLPYTSDEAELSAILDTVDGIFFTGGDDVSPRNFGADPTPHIGKIDRSRDDHELILYRLAATRDLPMLGICRGCQIMNVAAGGTLYQDIYTEYKNVGGHSPKEVARWERYHSVTLEPNSKIYEMLQTDQIEVNSFHHEAVKELAPSFRATAHAADGLIEAYESTELTFAVGIQWHPECMFAYHPEFSSIFQTFVQACTKYHDGN